MAHFTTHQLSEILAFTLNQPTQPGVGQPTSVDCLRIADEMLRYFGLTKIYRLSLDVNDDVQFEVINHAL